MAEGVEYFLSVNAISLASWSGCFKKCSDS